MRLDEPGENCSSLQIDSVTQGELCCEPTHVELEVGLLVEVDARQDAAGGLVHGEDAAAVGGGVSVHPVAHQTGRGVLAHRKTQRITSCLFLRRDWMDTVDFSGDQQLDRSPVGWAVQKMWLYVWSQMLRI